MEHIQAQLQASLYGVEEAFLSNLNTEICSFCVNKQEIQALTYLCTVWSPLPRQGQTCLQVVRQPVHNSFPMVNMSNPHPLDLTECTEASLKLFCKAKNAKGERNQRIKVRFQSSNVNMSLKSTHLQPRPQARQVRISSKTSPKSIVLTLTVTSM